MLMSRIFSKSFFAIIFIAIQAINTPATAQISGQNSLSFSGSGKAQSVVTTERVRAELLAHAPQGVSASLDDKITPNTVWVGLQLAHQPKWHTYWKNSGDSGLPTQLTWMLPVGVMAGDIAWPAPQKIKIGSLTNFGYEGTVVLAVPLTITPAFKPSLLNSNLDIKLKALWLVCKEECIPEEGEFALSIPTKGSTAINSVAFEGALKAQPKAILANAGAGIPSSRALVEGSTLKFEVQGLPVELRGKTLDFYPETAGIVENSALGEQAWQGAVWRISLPLSSDRSQSPATVPLVLKAVNQNGGQVGGQAWRADVAVQGAWPQAAVVATVSPGLAAALAENKAVPNANLTASPVNLTLLAALLGALLGGLILNLMPCVFPVLALKVVGFTQHAGNKIAHRRSGVAYFAGVVLSFVALGALFLAIRAGGEQLGWGFQLQNPLVVAGLAVLFTVLGMNLAGLFEFCSVLPSSVATARAKNPMVDSFLSGVLAVAVASPCTAPFMGASLGFALGLPVVEALLIFAAIGVGMALPYVAASFIPAVARALPKPGAWMDTFKKFMAFPMFATVIWLVWVLGQQSGIDGAGALLAILLVLCMVLWSFTLHGKAKAYLAIISIAILAYITPAIGVNITKNNDAPAASLQAGELWQNWEPGRVDQLLASGRPVFVDFTAAWCVTCQFNKKSTLSKPELLAEFESKKVQLLRADWTRRDPAIGAALKDLGRSGVPVYVLYAPGKAPQVLSEIISVDDVKAALAKL
jgi:thiol:disulfide interchange protein/DsbC/DsbD-like thiol-disulfide interchange protein